MCYLQHEAMLGIDISDGASEYKPESTYHDHVSLPLGCLAKLSSPLAWSGGSFDDLNKTILHLTDEDVLELDDALRTFQC
jgi:hypothetical protein